MLKCIAGEAPWSDLNLALKDVGHGLSTAKSAGTRLAVGEIALSHLQDAKEYSQQNGDRPLDSSSLYGAIRQEAGLDFRTDLVRKKDSS